MHEVGQAQVFLGENAEVALETPLELNKFKQVNLPVPSPDLPSLN